MEKRQKFKRVVPEHISVKDLKIEEVVCGTTKCPDGFHCYSQKKSTIRKHGRERVCRECGIDLIDWDRVHRNDLDDSDFVFKELMTEIIRHVFWHTPIEDQALFSALTRGRSNTILVTKKLLNTRIRKYNSFMDGRQTPMGKDEIVNYAQHATATCCRKCLEAWHNIPMESQLTAEQLDFCASLVMKYINLRVPELKDTGLEDQEALKIIENGHH